MLASPSHREAGMSELSKSFATTSISSSQDSNSLPSLEGGEADAGGRDDNVSDQESELSTPSSPSFTGSLSNSVALLVHNAETVKELLAVSRLQQQELQHQKDLRDSQRASPGWSQSFHIHHQWPVPAIQSSDELLISVKSVGLNPVDYKCVQYGFGIEEWPAVIGRDVAGVVEEVGNEVTNFKVGDRVSLSLWLVLANSK